MIVFSLLLILVAVGLLVLGLTSGSSALLIASIVTSLLAAISLVIGARRAAAARPTAVDEPSYADEPAYVGEPAFVAETRRPEPAMAGASSVSSPAPPEHAEAVAFAAGERDAEEAFRESDSRSRSPIWAEDADELEEPAVVPAQAAASDDDTLEPDPDDPADEPRPQAVRPNDAVRVAQLTDDVVVVDGRPRYHMSDCPFLADRAVEPLPVAEAVELGFTPCGTCRPVDRLVAAAARR